MRHLKRKTKLGPRLEPRETLFPPPDRPPRITHPLPPRDGAVGLLLRWIGEEYTIELPWSCPLPLSTPAFRRRPLLQPAFVILRFPLKTLFRFMPYMPLPSIDDVLGLPFEECADVLHGDFHQARARSAGSPGQVGSD